MGRKRNQNADPFEVASKDKQKREKRKLKESEKRSKIESKKMKSQQDQQHEVMSTKEKRIYQTVEHKILFKKIFMNRTCLKGRKVDFKFLEKEGFQVFDWLQFQGWESVLELDLPIYPRLVRLLYAHLNGDGSFFLQGTVHVLSPQVIGESLGLSLEEDNVPEDEVGRSKIWKNLTGLENIADGTNTIPVSSLSVDLKILHSIVVHCLLPRKGAIDLVSLEDAKMMWSIKEKKHVNLPKHILKHMIHTTSKNNLALAYGMFLTRIVQSLGIMINEEDKVELSHYDHINETTLKRMGYQKDSERGWEQKRDFRKRPPLGPEAAVAEDLRHCEVEEPDDAPHRNEGNPILAFMEAQFSRVFSRLDAFDARFDARLDALEGRFDALDGKVDALNGRVARLEAIHGPQNIEKIAPGTRGGAARSKLPASKAWH